MTKVPDFPSTNRCQVRAGGLCQSCKPREKTMSAKKRSRPTAPSAAPTGVPAPPRPAALPRPAAADNSTAGRAARPRIRITLSPEYQNKFDALTSELGSLGADDLSTTSVIEHLVDTVFYNAFVGYGGRWRKKMLFDRLPVPASALPPLLSLELAAAELELSCIARSTLGATESTPST